MKAVGHGSAPEYKEHNEEDPLFSAHEWWCFHLRRVMRKQKAKAFKRGEALFSKDQTRAYTMRRNQRDIDPDYDDQDVWFDISQE